MIIVSMEPVLMGQTATIWTMIRAREGCVRVPSEKLECFAKVKYLQPLSCRVSFYHLQLIFILVFPADFFGN